MQQKFEPQDLLELKDPYKDLGTKEALITNLDVLNQLSAKQIRELVTTMVLTCPSEEWDGFGTQIYLDMSATSTSNSEGSEEGEEDSRDFIIDLNAAYHVKNCMLSLLNPELSPYSILHGIDSIDKAFNFDNRFDAFNEYKPLVIILLGNQGERLADRLAELTPKSERSKIARIIELMFSNTIFPQQVRAAFELKRSQENQAVSSASDDLESIAADESSSELSDENTVSKGSEPNPQSKQEMGIEIDGVVYKHVQVYSNGLFGQSELRQRKQSCDNDGPLPTRLSGSLLEELHDDEKNCCEKYCSLF